MLDELLGFAMGKPVLHRITEQVDEHRLADGTNPGNMNANANYRKDGSRIECEWYNSALYDEQGRMTSILSQVLDTTARTQAETARQEAEALLKGSNLRISR